MELSELLARGVITAVVPFGSIEHQSSHLPLGTDALLADAVGRLVAGRLGGVLAPTQRVGDADQHIEAVGTLTLGEMTLTNLAVAIARSLARHGFRRIVLLSTHGGNRAALEAAVERLHTVVPRQTTLCATSGDVGPTPGAHSGEWITSVMLALHPELVALDRVDPHLADAVSSASAERGREHLARFVTGVLRDVARLNGRCAI